MAAMGNEGAIARCRGAGTPVGFLRRSVLDALLLLGAMRRRSRIALVSEMASGGTMAGRRRVAMSLQSWYDIVTTFRISSTERGETKSSANVFFFFFASNVMDEGRWLPKRPEPEPDERSVAVAIGNSQKA